MRLAVVSTKSLSNSNPIAMDFHLQSTLPEGCRLIIGQDVQGTCQWYEAGEVAKSSGFPEPGPLPCHWIQNWNNIKDQIELPSSTFDITRVQTWLPPVLRPQKILCIGLNYAEHAAETGAEKPEIPVVFNKFPNSLSGHQHSIKLPEISNKVDYEAELVVVIGKAGKNIAAENALDHVFGYTCGHDVSARDWQKEKPGKQWLLGKAFDSFGPIGPWVVTSEDIPNPGELDIEFRLNGQTMQKSNTKHFIFTIPFLISHLSKFTTLMPGDLLFTGTPSGVGVARNPQVFLKPGDKAEVEISSIGTLENAIA